MIPLGGPSLAYNFLRATTPQPFNGRPPTPVKPPEPERTYQSSYTRPPPPKPAAAPKPVEPPEPEDTYTHDPYFDTTMSPSKYYIHVETHTPERERELEEREIAYIEAKYSCPGLLSPSEA